MNGITDKLNRFRFKRFVLLGIFLFFIMLFAGGDYGLIRMAQLSKNLDKMHQRIDLLRINNIDLMAEKALLSSNGSYKKLIATEKYGMVSKGTILCRLVK